jgi:hypothetical protein
MSQQQVKKRGRPRKYGAGAQPSQASNAQTVTVPEKKTEAIASKFGIDFFKATGKSVESGRGLGFEERRLHDMLYEQERVPKEYISVRDDMYVKTENFRVVASQYIDKLYKAVKGKLQPMEIKALIFWDATRIWTEARVYQVFNQHPELKATLDSRKQSAGKVGGEATAEKRKVEFEAEGSQQTQSKQLVGVVIIDLKKLEGRLMTALIEAKASKSNKIEIPFDTEGNAVDVRAVS